eukprot:3810304-Pyramimonas_sp.AAC.1
MSPTECASPCQLFGCLAADPTGAGCAFQARQRGALAGDETMNALVSCLGHRGHRARLKRHESLLFFNISLCAHETGKCYGAERALGEQAPGGSRYKNRLPSHVTPNCVETTEASTFEQPL